MSDLNRTLQGLLNLAIESGADFRSDWGNSERITWDQIKELQQEVAICHAENLLQQSHRRLQEPSFTTTGRLSPKP